LSFYFGNSNCIFAVLGFRLVGFNSLLLLAFACRNIKEVF